VALGASLAFIGTPQLIRLFPTWDGYVIATIVGALAQRFVDFIEWFYKKFKRDNDNGTE
jgi:hypothetical protein